MALNANLNTWSPEDWTQAKTFIDSNIGTVEGQKAIYDKANTLGMNVNDLSMALTQTTGTSYFPEQITEQATKYGWGDMGGATATPTATPGTGLINSVQPAITAQTINPVGYTPQGATAQGYTAQGYTGTGYDAKNFNDAKGYTAGGYDTALIEGQESVSQALDRILSKDSPLLQQAEAGAMQTANSRGLINSSIAAGAGQDALIRSALPIAQGDVQTSFNVKQFNAASTNDAMRFSADAKNRAAEFSALAKNTAGMFNVEQSNNAREFAATARNVAQQFSAAAQNQARQFTAGEQNRVALEVMNQANTALRFAADAENAAATNNAAAYNTAMQNYADAMNAAATTQFKADTEVLLQGMRGETALALQNMQSQYGTTASGNALMSTLISQISATQQNPELATADKQTAIDNLIDLYNSRMSVADAFLQAA